MKVVGNIFLILIATMLLSSVQATKYHKRIFDVLLFGARGDGKHDDSRAFKNAWKHTCRYPGSTMYVPPGKKFVLPATEFKGRCKKNIGVEIDGTIIAKESEKWKCKNQDCNSWITFSRVEGFYINGSGLIDGNGHTWWNQSCKQTHNCHKKPTSLTVEHCKHVKISGLTFKDSPQMHVGIEKSYNVTLSKVTIIAPADSPNTDGIHIQRSILIRIANCTIGTGDDCVSIGRNSSHIRINRITCGPGHGISIGSLGEEGSKDTVEDVRVSHSKLIGTTNGARIKTWQGGSGYVRQVVFEDISLIAVRRPIIIDQNYCDRRGECQEEKSAVEISDVVFEGFAGSTTKPDAITLDCSKTVPCTNIHMSDIHIVTVDQEKLTQSSCQHAHGLASGTLVPDVPCLSHSS